MVRVLEHLSYDKRWRELRLLSLEKKRLWEDHTWPSRRVTIYWLPYYLITFMFVFFFFRFEKKNQQGSFIFKYLLQAYEWPNDHISAVYVSFEGLYPTYVYKAKGLLSSELHVCTFFGNKSFLSNCCAFCYSLLLVKATYCLKQSKQWFYFLVFWIFFKPQKFIGK